MVSTSRRFNQLSPSVFSLLKEETDRKKNKIPFSILDFSLGSPDIHPLPEIIHSMESSVSKGENYRYSIAPLPELIQAAITWHKKRNHISLEEDQICFLSGSQEALINLPLIYCDPQDWVIIPDPYYPAYKDGPSLSQANIWYCPMTEENQYQMDLRTIPKEIRKRAKLLFMCYPNNPTGAIATLQFLKEAIQFAKENELLIVYDNAYKDFTYTTSSPNFLSLPDALEVGIQLDSFSKTYGMAGARLGMISGNTQAIKDYKKFKSTMDYGIFLPIQYAAIAALNNGNSLVQANKQLYQARIDLMVNSFEEAGWKLNKPQGCMFIWAKIPDSYKDSHQFSQDLLEKTGILVTPGSAFGSEGNRFVRIALVQNEEKILEASRRLRKTQFFNTISNSHKKKLSF